MAQELGFRRLAYVDVFRGFALLYMVVCHLFTYFSDKSVYTSKPYYIPALNIPTLLPPPYMFFVVAGMSVWLMLEKRRDEGCSGITLAWKGIRRYGIYVLISLPFTWFMFGLNAYFTWAEAIQGIGLAAVVIASILSFKRFKSETLLLASIIIYSLKDVLSSTSIAWSVPYNLEGGITASILGLLFNMTFRGWFSLVSAAPMLLAGVAFIQWFTRGESKKVFQAGVLFFATAMLLQIIGFPANYYERNWPTIFYIIGISALACTLLHHLVEEKNWGGKLKPVSLYGFFSLYIYLGHFLFIVKPLEITGMLGAFNEISGWILAAMATTLLYALAEVYTARKKKVGFKLLNTLDFLQATIVVVVLIYVTGFVLNGFSTGEKILVVCAHPDDETFGAGGVIIKNVLAGNHVKILMFTDGSPSEFGGTREYAKQRRMELEKAMSVAGVAKRDIVYLGYDDLNFIFELGKTGIDESVGRIADIIRDYKPDKIYVHAYDHGNLDHDSVNYITVRAIEKTGVMGIKLYEFTQYTKFGYHTPIPKKLSVVDHEKYPVVELKMTAAEEDLKKKMGGYYVSQDQYGVCDLTTDWPEPRKECADSINKFFYHKDLIRKYPGYDYTKSPCLNDSCRHVEIHGGVNWSGWYSIIQEYENR